ncbi:hypothetical protein [Shewanella sp.]|uniref:hypothetical protein n=1 Tax=Shewanella sp. TaxID=50422 RepID=UPI003A97BC17
MQIRVQRGFAGILMLTIFGIVMVMMVSGAMRYIQSSQQAGTTAHAVTQAQIRAWEGVEAMRQFFYQTDPNELTLLSVGQTITFPSESGLSGRIVAISTLATTCVDGTQVTLDIFGTAAKTSSGVQSIFCVKSGKSLVTYELTNAVIIKGGLDLGGDLNIVNGDNSNTSFYVEGDVDGGGSLSGFSLLYSTGNVSLSGAQNDIGTVAAEGDVTLTGSGAYGTVNAMGSISMSGGINTLSAKANGDVVLHSSAAVSGRLTAIGNVTMEAGTNAGEVYTQGNIDAINAHIGNVLAEGNFTESSNGSADSGQVGGDINYPEWNNQVKVSRLSGLKVPITLLKPAEQQALRVDAWPLRSASNLAFDVDAAGNILVQVRNMSGINNGNYYLTGNGNKQDYLCDGPIYSESTCHKKVCVGYSDSNSCFKYVSKDKEWQLNGKQFVPAVLWFNGSVDIGVGSYIDTIIATQNIMTSGSHTIKSINFAGYEASCKTTNFLTFYATNLCSVNELEYNALANVALIAGGYVNDEFEGGDISLGASTEVYGSVIAGNLLFSGGSSKIYGYVTVANQGDNTEGSDFHGSTTIDLSNLPDIYNPAEVITGSTEENNGSVNPQVTQLWSRYL